MSLAAGSLLGPYEILSPLGAGGMGEVYLARDTRLGREVAIKVLPAHLSGDRARRERFEREARAVSALNHPHICTLHDIGSQDGIDFLVLERVDGETVEERLKRGPLPIDQVLRYAAQIADALDRAHRKGVVHRDLKPGNVMLTKAGAKLLDFGLAKLGGAVTADPGGLSVLPTEHPSLTAQGSILGTFQYMAPEQLEGKEVDARTDLFAFGTLIYEMATGKRAFEAGSQASLIAAILEREPPPLSTAQPLAPAGLERLVRICLAKDPDDRWQSAGDLRRQIEALAEAGSSASSPAVQVAAAPRRLPRGYPWAVLGVAGILCLALITQLGDREIPAAPRLEVEIASPPGATFALAGDNVASVSLSPDGELLAFVAQAGDTLKLWVRNLATGEARPLEGTDYASYPFWSPDGKFIAFLGDNRLRKVPAGGGAVIDLAPAAEGRGGSWSSDGTILYAPYWRERLHRVSADGGEAVPITEFDTTKGETTHRSPWFLPDGKHFLYLAANHAAAETSGEHAIYLSSTDAPGERRLLLHARSNVQYSGGHLIYVQGRKLVAQPFDADRLELRGEPQTLVDGIRFETGYFHGAFTAAGDRLVFQRGGSATFCELVWLDRSGREIGRLGGPDLYREMRLSPDDRTLAVSIGDPGDIWLWDLGRDVKTRFTLQPMNEAAPVWSPDGRWLYYYADWDGLGDVWRKAVDGSSEDESILATPRIESPTSVSPDGSRLLVRHVRADDSSVLRVVPLAGGEPSPALAVEKQEWGGQFSPDGRWIAYTSDASGRNEVYLAPYPGGKGRRQVSTAGGGSATWREDGRELFYLTPDDWLAAVTLGDGANPVVGAPTRLFAVSPQHGIVWDYEATRDGQRFLVNRMIVEPGEENLTLVTNWTSRLAS